MAKSRKSREPTTTTYLDNQPGAWSLNHWKRLLGLQQTLQYYRRDEFRLKPFLECLEQ